MLVIRCVVACNVKIGRPRQVNTYNVYSQTYRKPFATQKSCATRLHGRGSRFRAPGSTPPVRQDKALEVPVWGNHGTKLHSGKRPPWAFIARGYLNLLDPGFHAMIEAAGQAPCYLDLLLSDMGQNGQEKAVVLFSLLTQSVEGRASQVLMNVEWVRLYGLEGALRSLRT